MGGASTSVSWPSGGPAPPPLTLLPSTSGQIYQTNAVQPVRVGHGQIWSVTLDPTVANEQRGTRPYVVVSVDRFNALPIGQAIVVPLTTRERRFPHHIPVTDDGGVNRPSWAMCEAVRSVSVERFGQFIGTANSHGHRDYQSVDALAWPSQLILGSAAGELAEGHRDDTGAALRGAQRDPHGLSRVELSQFLGEPGGIAHGDIVDGGDHIAGLYPGRRRWRAGLHAEYPDAS
jgi:mRNA interferase MazF